MSSEAKDLLTVLKEQFYQDGEDVLNALEQSLSTFMDEPVSAVDAILRATHNLKGSAQLSGFTDFSKLMHALETSVQLLVGRDIQPDSRQTCYLYLKRLVAQAVKYFNSLSENAEFDSKELEVWVASLEAVETIAKHSPLASIPETRPAVSPEFADLGGWGMTTPDVRSDSHPITLMPAVSEDKGWGIFEDSPAPSLPHEGVSSNQLGSVMSPMGVQLQPQSTTGRLASVEHVNKLLNQKRASQEEAPAREDYLICLNDGASFAIPVKYIQEILPNREDRPLPVRKKDISGVISFRGKVMAIATLFDRKDRSDLYAATRCIVVCQIGKRQFGFRVDHVSSVLGVDQNTLQPLPGGVDETSIVRNLAMVDGKTISFVDPKMVIST